MRRLGLDVDGAAMLLDDVVSWLIDSPSLVPSPAGLVVKKWIEHLFLHLGRNAGAIVANPDFDCLAQVFRGRIQCRLKRIVSFRPAVAA